jgi:hypothetical protein
MRRACVIGCLLCAALVFAASSASALESTWLINGARASSAIVVDSEGELVLEASKGGPFGGAISVECHITDEGLIGPGPADETIKITFSLCKGGILCEGTPSAFVHNLPWDTHIELVGSSFYDDIVAKSGEVEYTVECKVLGFTAEISCKWSLGRALLANSGSNVRMLFSTVDVVQPAGNCSTGGAGTGLLSGFDTLFSVEGLTIAVGEG